MEYGSLGRDVEYAVRHNPDMESKAVSTGRVLENVRTLTSRVKVYHTDETVSMRDEIDVLILCGGSSMNLSVQTPGLAKRFNMTDSFDTRARIPEHFNAVNGATKENGHVRIISVDWDPGMFSLNRLYAGAVLPGGYGATSWGEGMGQGHPDTIRGIDGMKDARQYTIPVEFALEAVRTGKGPELTAREKHMRECSMVAEKGADLERIGKEIVTTSDYFANYDTTVHFISEEELMRDHVGILRGGVVTRSGKTDWEDENSRVIGYSLRLDPNPESIVSVVVAYARAVYRLNQEEQTGCRTVFDVVPAYLSAESGEELRRHLL